MGDLYAVEAQVRRLHALYADAVWRMDVAAFGACFIEDAEWRVGGFVLRGRDRISQFMGGAFTKYRRILLTFRTPIVSIGEEGVTARTYVTEQSVLANGQSFAPIGTYFDRFSIEGDALLFRWRMFQTHYAGPPDLSGTFFDNPDYGPPPAMPPVDEPTFDRSGILTGRSPSGT